LVGCFGCVCLKRPGRPRPRTQNFYFF
jgi:hypothetical protein